MGKKCIGIDVGGTTVKLGLFEMDGTLLEKWEIPTRKEENGTFILPDAAASVKEKLSERGLSLSDLAGAGLGLPGPVMPDGFVGVCVNLGWKNKNPQKELSALLDGALVRTGNDANVAALGEMWQGGGKGCSNVVAVTLGTGVGGGVIRDIMASETPYILVREVYASASIAGGIVCIVCRNTIGEAAGLIFGLIVTVVIRALAAHFHRNLLRIH